MLNDLLKTAELYAHGLDTVQKRREQWIKKHEEIRDHLRLIADYLNNKSTYKQGFFVDTLHAFNEDINGTSAKLPSVTFRSGAMPMLVTFRNSMGEKKSFKEDGFHISFNPTITGQIIILLLPHQSELNKTPLPYTTIAVINNPIDITMDFIEQVIARGMEAAYYTSFTGMGEQPNETPEQTTQPIAVNERNPIGFKRYETTEKIK